MSQLLAFATILPGLLLVLASVLLELSRPDLLIVGPVTTDVFTNGSTALGGAVSYAAAVASSLGVKACIVTVAGPDVDLSMFDGHELHVIPSDKTMTFAHSVPDYWLFKGADRVLHVTALPNVTLSRKHVPLSCQRARTVLLAPLIQHDMDAPSFFENDGLLFSLIRGRQQIGLIAQGFQRRIGKGGKVESIDEPSEQLQASLDPSVSLFMSHVETEVWPQAAADDVASRLSRMVVTHGKVGAYETNSTGHHHIPPEDIPRVTDTNGAGDTFATSYMLHLSLGVGNDPAKAASWAASRAVMMPQSCKPSCTGDLFGKGVLLRKSRLDLLASAIKNDLGFMVSATTNALSYMESATTNALSCVALATNDAFSYMESATTNVLRHMASVTTDALSYVAVATTDALRYMALATTNALSYVALATTNALSYVALATTDALSYVRTHINQLVPLQLLLAKANSVE